MNKETDLNQLINSRDAPAIAQYMKEHNLCVNDYKIAPNTLEAKINIQGLSKFYDSRQQARKILFK